MTLSRRSAVLTLAGGAALAVSPSVAQEASPTAEQIEERKTKVRRWIEDAENAGNVEVLREIVSPSYTSSAKENAPGVDALIERTSGIYDRFTAAYGGTADWAIEQMIAADDSVCARVTFSASLGGRQTAVTFLEWFVFGADDLITTAWRFGDQAQLEEDLYG